MDHMRRHTLKMEHVNMVVLDEADEMLNMGFREDIETILQGIPSEHQTALFSATMPKPILEITDTYQKDAVYLKMTKQELTIPLVKQYYYRVNSQIKVEVASRLLDYYGIQRSLIFCNTKRMVDELSEAMRNFRTRVLERNEMEAWQKLIRVLTHEIMNSITPIISLSETLSEREVSEKNYPVMRQGMQTIHRRSKGLLEFVENYRKLTRLPAPVRRPVAVHELLQDLQKLFSEEYIRIELPETDRILQIDRTQIEQVLINLIKNAKEACSRKEHPLIEVKMLPALSWQCLITVSDNGEGILPEVQDKIFVPFFTTKPSGSGIGLSLCKQVMNRHGGNITVQSAVGKGSCFTLLFG
mgnify:CR=1 FL=1